MFRDGAGQAVISTQAGQSIAQWANVPVYVMTDTALGTGAVGGSVASVEAFGKRAGEMARLVLNGAAPASLPLETDTETVPIFDWRALKRWGISESRLPPNSIVRFQSAVVVGGVPMVPSLARCFIFASASRNDRRLATAANAPAPGGSWSFSGIARNSPM